jgi:hypothetical protein
MPEITSQTKSRYAALVAALLIAWFVFAFLASGVFHLYRTAPYRPPGAVAAGALGPVLIFLAWFGLSRGFREFVLSLNLRTLTLLHSWRVIGVTMVVLASYGMLPWLFAAPAGFGDIAVGVTAPYAALSLANPLHRSRFLRWHLLGVLDLVIALSTAALSGILTPHSPPASLMTVLPMSIIPTFGVPLYLILHIISIAQARRWPKERQPSSLRPSLRTA